MDSPAGPIKCREARPLLAAYHRGELPSKISGDVETHLAACDVCRAELEYTARALAAIAEIKQPDHVSELCLQRLRQKARESAEERTKHAAKPLPWKLSHSFSRRFAAAAVIFVAFVAAGIIMIMHRGMPLPSTRTAPTTPIARAPHSAPALHVALPPRISRAAPEPPIVSSPQKAFPSLHPGMKTAALKTRAGHAGKHSWNPALAKKIPDAPLWRQTNDPVRKQIVQIAREIDTKFASAPALSVYSTGWRNIDTDIVSISSDLAVVENKIDEL